MMASKYKCDATETVLSKITAHYGYFNDGSAVSSLRQPSKQQYILG